MNQVSTPGRTLAGRSTARDVVAMGGNALPLALDVRDAEAIDTRSVSGLARLRAMVAP